MYRNLVTSEAALRSLIPEPSSKVKLKILDTLERHSQHMIAMSSLVALSCAKEDGPPSLSLLTARGAVVPQGDHTLRLDDPEHTFREAWALEAGMTRGVGGLFMVGGIEETLRVNGSASACPTGSGVLIAVEEAFLQCPKAFVRSHLWDPETWKSGATRAPAASLAEFVERSPFALVCTEGGDGRGDVSPRGDPPGLFVRALDASTLLVPDRSGNALVDTLRNVLVRPHATLVLVIPGAPSVIEVRGRARITADRDLLAPSAVKGKAPKVGIVIDVESLRTPADSLAALWNADALIDPKDFPTMGEMILDQINPNGKTLNKIGSKIFDLASSYHKRRRLY